MGIGSYFYRTSKRLSRVHLYEWLDEAARALPKNEDAQILNIGSGGEIQAHIRSNVASHIVQVDIDPDRKPDVVTSVCDMPMFADASIDAIFMMEVLEHVTEPHQAIREIQRVLKPGGTFILSTPFIFPLHDEPYDYYRYTKYGLAYMLRDFGDVVIRERNRYLDSILVLQSRLMIKGTRRQRMAGHIVFVLNWLFYTLMRPLAALCTPEKATTGYFVTARRKV